MDHRGFRLALLTRSGAISPGSLLTTRVATGRRPKPMTTRSSMTPTGPKSASGKRSVGMTRYTAAKASSTYPAKRLRMSTTSCTTGSVFRRIGSVNPEETAQSFRRRAVFRFGLIRPSVSEAITGRSAATQNIRLCNSS